MIVPTLLRLAIYRALIGRTLAGSNVCDSRLGLIDESMAADDEYVIIVRSDDEKLDDLFRADSPRSSVVIEMMVTSRMAKSQSEEGNEDVRDIPQTNSGLELVLGMMSAQVLAAFRDLENPWSNLIKRLMVRGYKVTVQHGGNEKNSTRRAAVQLVIESDLLSEPVLGEPLPDGVVKDAIVMMEADTNPYGLEVYGRSLMNFFAGAPVIVDPDVARGPISRETGNILNFFDRANAAFTTPVIDSPLPGADE